MNTQSPHAVLWRRIDEELSSKGNGIKYLKMRLQQINRPRNKNTYTNWKNHPELKISDIYDIAEALEIPPSQLLRNGESIPEPLPEKDQLELPFEGESKTALVEIECMGSRLILRKPPSRENGA